MPVLGIALMTTALFVILQKYGENLKEQKELAENE